MALKGTISKSITGRTYVIEWSAAQSITNNTSTITCVHKLINNASYSLNISARENVNTNINTCTVNGETKNYASPAIKTSGGTTHTLGTTTHVVKHKDDGTIDSITITGVFNIMATLSGKWVKNITATGTISLDTIPRASTIDSLTCSTSYFDGTLTYYYTPKSANYYNQCNIALYVNGTYQEGLASIKIGKKSASQTHGTYVLSADNLDTIYGHLSKTTKGVLRFTFRTYSDSNYSTQIGSGGYKEITLTIPTSIKPRIGTITLNPANINNKNILVKNKNKLGCSVEGCSAGAGSTISSYTFSGPSMSKTVSTTATSASTTISSVSSTGTLTYKVTIKDARGRTASKSATITCYDYDSPSFTKFNAYRADKNGTADVNGDWIKCTYTEQHASVNSTNAISVIAYYSDSSTMKTAQGLDGSVLIDLNGDKNTTYKIYLKITDSYGGSSTSHTITVFGQSRILNITKNGTGFAIGKMADKNNLFECRWPSKFDDNVDSSGNIRINSDDSKVFEVTRTNVQDDVNQDGTNETGNIQMQLYIHDDGHATCRRRYMLEGESEYTLQGYWQLRDSNMYVSYPMAVNGAITATRGRFTATTDANPTAQNDVPLRVGTASAEHLDIDGNEIIAKDTATTVGTLGLVGANIDMYSGSTLTLRVSKDETSEHIKSMPTYNRTYDGSPNMYITSNGVFGRGTSSSQRYKTDIDDVVDDKLNPYNILNIPVRQFKYNEDNVPINKNKDDLYIGFIAEEVEAAYPIAAEYNENGQVEMWNIKVIVPAMLKIIQDQQKEIECLKNTINNIVGTSSKNVE